MKVYTAKDYVPKDTWIYAIYRHPEHTQPRLDLVMYHDDDVMFGCVHDRKGWIPMGFVLVDDVLKEFVEGGYDDKKFRHIGEYVAWPWYDEKKVKL